METSVTYTALDYTILDESITLQQYYSLSTRYQYYFPLKTIENFASGFDIKYYH